MFGVEAKQLEEASKAQVINTMALMIALVEAGVITYDQINNARGMATHVVDQAWQARMDELKAETR